MTALLALIPAKDWFYAALIAGILIAGGMWHHATLLQGISKQKAADDVMSLAILKNTAQETADLQARATMAEQAHDKAELDLQNFSRANPVQPVRLCFNSHPGSGIVPSQGAVKPGDASASAANPTVQQVPSGNSDVRGGAGPDISQLLNLLAQRADEVSSELAEYQSR